MRICPKFHVKKRTLLAIAGFIWLIAGFNVARLGVLAYKELEAITLIHGLLSILVFSAFGFMFYRMSHKHSRRINGFKEKTRPLWHFFDLKAYIIMAFMMGGGIWLRGSGLAPVVFIAVFYTGLGAALAMAGLSFGYMFFTYQEEM